MTVPTIYSVKSTSERLAPSTSYDSRANAAPGPLASPSAASISRKALLDVLGVAPWQSSNQTFGHRWRGEDSLTWGDPDMWIRVQWALNRIENPGLQALLNWDKSFQSILADARLPRLREIYAFRNPDQVRSFLVTHPDLVEVLFEARSYLEALFGSDLEVILEVVTDPDAEGLKQLFAYIHTSLPIDDALERLDRLDEEWFLDQLDRVDGLCNFNLEIR